MLGCGYVESRERKPARPGYQPVKRGRNPPWMLAAPPAKAGGVMRAVRSRGESAWRSDGCGATRWQDALPSFYLFIYLLLLLISSSISSSSSIASSSISSSYISSSSSSSSSSSHSDSDSDTERQTEKEVPSK